MNVLLSAEQIQSRIRELGAEIEHDYPSAEEIHLVGVLKGGFMFMADLVRTMSACVTLDFIAVSSYQRSTRSSGEVRMLKDLDSGLEGRHGIIVTQRDQAHALSIAANHRQLADRQTDEIARCGHDHQLIGLGPGLEDERAS